MHLSKQRHAYLRDFCKLSIGLTALLSHFHGNSVVVHKGPVHTQLAGLQGGRRRVWDRCETGVTAPYLSEKRASVHSSGETQVQIGKAAGTSASPCRCLPLASPPHTPSLLPSPTAT